MNLHVKPEVISVDARTVRQWLDDDQAVLVDVRETSEFDQEHIPGALLQPMSVFDPELFPTVPGKKVVLHCAVGKRSEAAGKMLLNEGHENVMHMTGGIKAWNEAGFETEIQFIPPQVPDLAPVPDQAKNNPSLVSSAKPGKVLVDEFMTPLQLTALDLADAIGVEKSEIIAVIEGRSAVTAALSLRLARYFCTDNDFWLNLQLKCDLEEATLAIGTSLFSTITPRLCA